MLMLQYFYWFQRLFIYLMSRPQNQLYEWMDNPSQWIYVLKMETFIEITDLKWLITAVIFECDRKL